MATRSKLAVILHADVVGSTALVQKDERLAHDRIQDVFRRFSEIIAVYGGATHELRGDALLAEFNRASDAVSAALAFQANNAEHIRTVGDMSLIACPLNITRRIPSSCSHGLYSQHPQANGSHIQLPAAASVFHPQSPAGTRSRDTD
jgi:inosine-uridine nucleoside N-ribohydrolase